MIGESNVTFTIPASLPAGDYLMRIEHIGLHVAQSAGGAQFYISCGQLTVTGGGSGSPSPLVAFPGAYSATDPSILINIYSPVVGILINNDICDEIDLLTYSTAEKLFASGTCGLDWLRMRKREFKKIEKLYIYNGICGKLVC